MKVETILRWPDGWKKSESVERFNSWSNLDIAKKHLENTMLLLNANDVILTYNKTGYQVSIYFKINNKKLCIASDKWNRIEDNLTSICLFFEALLKCKNFINEDIIYYCLYNLKENSKSNTTYTNIKKPLWCNVLGVEKSCTKIELKKKYHELCKTAHPDNGGSNDEFILLKQAYEEGLKYAG